MRVYVLIALAEILLDGGGGLSMASSSIRITDPIGPHETLRVATIGVATAEVRASEVTAYQQSLSHCICKNHTDVLWVVYFMQGSFVVLATLASPALSGTKQPTAAHSETASREYSRLILYPSLYLFHTQAWWVSLRYR